MDTLRTAATAALLAATAAMTALTAPVHAATPARAVAQGITGPEMVAILQDAGYRARLDSDGDGEPLVRTGMGGVDMVVLFYDCTAHRCNSLQFSAGFDLANGTTDAVINRFNRDYRYVRAFLDDEQDPFLRLDFEVVNTDHAAFIASQIDTYEQLLPEFQRAIGFGAGEDG